MSYVINNLSDTLKEKLKKALCDCDCQNVQTNNQKENAKLPPFEGFASPATADYINQQTNNFQRSTDELFYNIYSNNQLAEYQEGIYSSFESLNYWLLILYYLLFIYITVNILNEYVIGVERKVSYDIALVLGIFAFPFVINSLEMIIINNVLYVLQYISYLFISVLNRNNYDFNSMNPMSINSALMKERGIFD